MKTPSKMASRSMVVLGLVLGLIISMVVSGYGIVRIQYLGKIDYDVDTEAKRPVETGLEALEVEDNIRQALNIPVLEDNRVTNYLLIGTDARHPDEASRSDAMMVLSINTKNKTFTITSLMRAIFVSIPDDPDPEMRPYFSSQYMLNAAHTWGGARLLMRTIERNFRIVLDGYLSIDFGGFETIVDQSGGVTISLSSAEASALSRELGRSYAAGSNLLDGAAALSYSRLRNIDSDFARTGRQRNVIESMLRQAFKSGPTELLDFASSILPYVKTNLSQATITNHILNVLSYANYDIQQMMIPIDGTSEMFYYKGMEMYRIDFTANIEAMRDLINK